MDEHQKCTDYIKRKKTKLEDFFFASLSITSFFLLPLVQSVLPVCSHVLFNLQLPCEQTELDLNEEYSHVSVCYVTAIDRPLVFKGD